MPDCCRCNGLGTCRRCSCAKAGRLCENCLPGRKGRCANQPPIRDSSSIATTPAPQIDEQATTLPPTISLTSQFMPVSSQTPLPTTTWSVTPPQPCPTQPPAQLSASLLSTILPISLSEERSSYFIDEPPIPLTPTGDPITATSTPSSPVFSSEVSPAVGIDTFDLPPFPPLDLDQVFTWGSADGISFTKDLDDAYTAVVRWKRNLFKVPFGNLGRNFVSELARLFREYANNSALESVALKAAMTMPSLLLQRPHKKSK